MKLSSVFIRVHPWLIVLLFAFGCASLLSSPILTQTELGQPVAKIEPARTGDRANVPSGVKPRDIVAHTKSKTGAETWVDKKGNIYQNEQAQQENAAPPDRPERSYAWAWWTGGILAALIVIDRLFKTYLGVNPFGAVCKFIKRLFGGKA